MRVKIRGEWVDASDEALVVELTQGELDQINGIPRESDDHRPRRYGQFPDSWSREQMQDWMGDGSSPINHREPGDGATVRRAPEAG